MKKTVWTAAYNPFILGGDVNAPIATELEVVGPFDLGGGFEGYLAVSPKGVTHVVESETGAFVGTSIDDVKTAIAAADPAVMRKQITDAKVEFKKANHVLVETFWGKFR